MKHLFLILTLLSFITSCDKNDNSNRETNNIEGSWYLTKFEKGFAPTDTYNIEIQWTFNSNNTVDVLIVNGTNIDSRLPLQVSGNYPYSINGNTILLNNESYTFEIIDNQLFLTKDIGPSADGIRVILNKIQ